MKSKKNTNNFLQSKKGIGVWISWILIIAFVVGLASIISIWMKGFTQNKAETIQESFYNTQECDEVALNLDNACYNTTTHQLTITISNKKNIQINKVVLNTIDQTGTTLNTTTLNISLAPGRKKTKTLNIQTNLINGTATINPIIKINNKQIYCNEKGSTQTITTC